MRAPIVERHNVSLFESSWRHIKAAEARGQDAAEVWNAFLDEDPYEAVLSINEEGVAKLFVETVGRPPADLSILIGEFFYHLRAALDNAVYDTATHHTRRDPPPSASALEFPIAETEAQFRAAAYKIKPLGHQHRATIEAVQPFRHTGGPKASPFYWINDLARKDRHRALHFVGAYIAHTNPQISVPPGVTAKPLATPTEQSIPLLYDYAEVARWKLTPYTDAISREVEANPDIAIDPEIGEMAEDRPVGVEWLWETFSMRLWFMRIAVDATVGKLEQDCFGHTRSKYVKKPDRR